MKYLQRILLSLLGILILVYIGYQIFRGTTYSNVKTETAIYGTLWNTVSVRAAAVRDETLIEGGGSDAIISYTAPNGSHVPAGGAVATIYQSEREVKNALRIAELEREIEEMEALDALKDTLTLTPQKYDEKISEELIAFEKLLADQAYSRIPAGKHDLLSILNQKDIAIGKVTDYSGRIAELQNQLDRCRAAAPEQYDTVYTEKAGFFISSADGYEGAFDYDHIEDITVDDLDFDSIKPKKTVGVIGRICENATWYLVFHADSDTATLLQTIAEEQEPVYLKVPYGTMTKVPAEILSINRTSLESDAAVVLSCDYMNEALAALRFDEIEIELYSYSGVLVDLHSIHFANVEETIEKEDGTVETKLHEHVQGVYVVDGATMKFVQIFPQETINGYIVCRTDLRDGDLLYTSRTIELYDEVITGGGTLYDGKLLE